MPRKKATHDNGFFPIGGSTAKRTENLEPRPDRYARILESLENCLAANKLLSDLYHDGVVYLDGTTLIYANPRFYEMFGYEPKDILGKDTVALTVAQEHRDFVRQISLTTSEKPYTSLGQRKDGSVFPVEARGSFAEYDGKRVRVAIISDMTDRVASEKALRKNEFILSRMGKIAKVGGWEADVNTGLMEWTSEIFNLVEMESGLPLSLDECMDRFTEDSKPTVKKALRDMLEKGKSFSLESELVTAKGNRRWFRITGEAVFKNNKCQKMRGTLQDIALQRASREKLRESEDRLRRVIQNMPVMLDAFGEDDRLLVWNRQCEIVTGYSAREMVSSDTILEKLYPDSAYRSELLREWSSRGDEFSNWEMNLTRKDGEIRRVSWSNMSTKFPIPGWKSWAIGVDVTERWKAEEEVRCARNELEQRVEQRTRELQQAKERVRALSWELIKVQEQERRSLALDLHDNVAQHLSSLKLGIDAMFKGCEDDGQEKLRISMSNLTQKAISSLRELTKGLHPPGLDQLTLETVISRLCRDFTHNRKLVIDFTAAGINDLSLDYSFKINIYRIIQESLNNIAKHSGASRATVRLVASHPHLIVRIEDNGRGFDVEKRKTEALTDNRLGLSGMEERAALMHGTLMIHSQTGKGTKILVELPVDKAAQNSLSKPAARHPLNQPGDSE